MAANCKNGALAMACSLALMSIAPPGIAQNGKVMSGGGNGSTANNTSGNNPAGTGTTRSGDDLADATDQVNEAAKVVQQMKSDPQVNKLMQQAKAIFIVPDYGRAGLVIGGQGGEGVLVARNRGKWSGPVFYHLGGVSIGAQAGAAAGSIAMLLMNDKAVNSFRQNNNFSLNVDAGLSIINYSARAQGSAGNGDVIVWSGTEGAYAGATVGVTDIHPDDADNRAFYRKSVSAQDIISGKVSSPQARRLEQVLPG